MNKDRSLRFWKQLIAFGMGLLIGEIVNNRFGKTWSTWQRFGVVLACIFLMFTLVSLLPPQRWLKDSN